MDDPAIVTKQLVELAKKRIEDQHSRIVRHRDLMTNMSQALRRSCGILRCSFGYAAGVTVGTR